VVLGCEKMEKYQIIKVGAVMNSEYYTIDPSATIHNAVKLMGDKDTHVLVVVNKEKLAVGILTERDIVIRVLSRAKKMSETSIEEIMTSPVRTCGPNTPITDAMRHMAKKKIRQLLVVKNGTLLGVFLARDAFSIAPELIDTLAELTSVRGKEYLSTDEEMSGYCEECEEYSNLLKIIEGRILCEYCREPIEFQNMMTIKNSLIA